MKKYIPQILILATVVIFSCAPGRFVKPLKEKEKAVSFNLGGPLIGFAGTTIPMPLSSITYGQGITESATVFGSLHTTALLYGTVQAETGFVKELRSQDSLKKYIPGISVSPVLNFAADVWEKNTKAWPELDVNAYWNINKNKQFIYAGVSNWFELAGKKAHNEIQTTHWLINPHVGISGQNKKWNSNFELKWLAPFTSNKDMVVDYKMIGNKGAIGLYYTIVRKF